MKKSPSESWIGPFPLPVESARGFRAACVGAGVQQHDVIKVLVEEFLKDPPKRVIETARKMK